MAAESTDQTLTGGEWANVFQQSDGHGAVTAIVPQVRSGVAQFRVNDDPRIAAELAAGESARLRRGVNGIARLQARNVGATDAVVNRVLEQVGR